ncbi:transposable element Tc3 transposase-like Protein [Elysia marginata]|uniref:Transposable element Tc3 transposase-like Protein n=1 Tax=Elysia marginata TaxID=1093978 RepID=A0AAV4JFB2_9GAST|nr:transposable element Tc3 transposase-like Protein [Elysia marginata]
MHRNIVFQQDNARANSIRYTQQFLEQSNVQVLLWPALSPDLNPIKNLWDYLQRRLNSQDHRPQNAYDLEHSLRRHWNAVPRHFYRLKYLRWDVDVLLYWKPKGGTHIISRSLS